MKYSIEVIRTYSAELEVEAESPEEAAELADKETANLSFYDTGDPEEFIITDEEGETVYIDGYEA